MSAAKPERVLSIRQPWAALLLVDGPARKDVENRTRNVAGAFRGTIAVHASLEADYQARIPWAARPFSTEFVDALARGGIVGTVDLVDVHHADDCGNSLHPSCSPWSDPGRFHLVTENPRPLAELVPFRGSLGLRTLPDDIAELVAATPTWEAAP